MDVRKLVWQTMHDPIKAPGHGLVCQDNRFGRISRDSRQYGCQLQARQTTLGRPNVRELNIQISDSQGEFLVFSIGPSIPCQNNC